MKGRVPDPDWFEFDVFSDTNCGCPACVGDRVAEAPVTASLGAHVDDDFPVLASIAQTIGVHVLVPDDIAGDLHVVGGVHDFLPDVIDVQVVEVHDFAPDVIPVDVQVLVTHDSEPDDIGVQVLDVVGPVVPLGGIGPLPGGVVDPGGSVVDPGGCPLGDGIVEVGVEGEAQPV